MDDFLIYVGAAALMFFGGWIAAQFYTQARLKDGTPRIEIDTLPIYCWGAMATGVIVGIIRFAIA